MKFDKEKLVEYRAFANLTQAELDKDLGVEIGRTAKYEGGYNVPRKTMVHRLAKALGVSYVELLKFEEDELFIDSTDNKSLLKLRISRKLKKQLEQLAIEKNLTTEQIAELLLLQASIEHHIEVPETETVTTPTREDV